MYSKDRPCLQVLYSSALAGSSDGADYRGAYIADNSWEASR